MWGVWVFVVFMALVVGFVFYMLYISSKKQKSENVKTAKAKKKIKQKVKKNKKFDNEKEQDGKYEMLFPNVMIDEDDENMEDADKALDEMMFMDLMDED